VLALNRDQYVVSRLSDGTIQITRGDEVDVFSEVEVFRFADRDYSAIELLTTRRDGTPGNDTLIGTPGGDALYGGDGADIIRALAGDDYLSGARVTTSCAAEPESTLRRRRGRRSRQLPEHRGPSGRSSPTSAPRPSERRLRQHRDMSSIEGLGGGYAVRRHLPTATTRANVILAGTGDAAFGHGGDDWIQGEGARPPSTAARAWTG
jgi:Ca2+-binding RTX toxin-like protein